MSINITGCGGYLPKKTVLNDELEQQFQLEPGWIVRRTGIEERHVLDDEDYIELCFISATQAIQNAKITEQDIELIILATTTPQQIMPSSASLVQSKLGIKQSIAFDMQAACTGFIYALIVAESFMRANHVKHALVLGCDVFSHIVDPNDPITGVLFGDGFGAVVLENDEQSLSKGIFYTHYASDISGINELNVPWGLAQSIGVREQSLPYVCMNGKEVFKSAVRSFSDEISRAMLHNNLLVNDLGCIITHQANIRIINAVCQNLGISEEQCEVSLTKQGNTSAASIPLALHQLMTKRELKPGEIILLTGFGAGYTMGTVMFSV